MFRRLEAELRRTMILMGVPSLKALGPRNLVPLDGKGERLLAAAKAYSSKKGL
jgi:isopentenyl diphosphate isomerase/L-lactate dehydrogenase-like FMN-dependent dehydrogenase